MLHSHALMDQSDGQATLSRQLSTNDRKTPCHQFLLSRTGHASKHCATCILADLRVVFDSHSLQSGRVSPYSFNRSSRSMKGSLSSDPPPVRISMWSRSPCANCTHTSFGDASQHCNDEHQRHAVVHAHGRLLASCSLMSRTSWAQFAQGG